MNFLRPFRDFRGVCLAAALLATLLALAMPGVTMERAVFNHLFVVDITRSMNVEDYQLDGRAVSRLDFVKDALSRSVRELPCGSRVGLGLFTERRSTLLFEPIEVCGGFNEIDRTLQRLDWRMAWAADSRIAKGLSNAMELLKDYDANLIFLTDGHEAPPVNPRYAQSFDGLKGELGGLIVGVGGLVPAPIPKFDVEGRRIGFYTEADVPHRSTFGLPDKDPSEIEGYNARNAPFGSEAVIGSEHLSSLREPYLKSLAAESGLDYHCLKSARELSETLRASRLAEARPVVSDISGVPALFALSVLGLSYLVTPLIFRRDSARS